jgi:hypothetical protein
MSDYYHYDIDELPLFAATRAPVERTDEDRESSARQAKTLLACLKAGEWITTQHLVVHVGHRFSTSVQSLRELGWIIDKRPGEGRQYEYKLIGKVDLKPIEKSWADKYRDSAHWKARRQQRLTVDGFKCCDCKATENLEVHHWRYDLFEERLQDLMTLCHDCHQRLHARDCLRLSFPKKIDEKLYYLLP